MTGAAFFGAFELTWMDFTAVLLFGGGWVGYVYFAAWQGARVPSLHTSMDRFRREWVVQMVGRDNRMMDVNVMRNLTRSSQFFASTTMLILGALVALMGYAEKAAGVLAELPFAQQVSERVWELKILLLVLIFVYAFFKFSWSIRQFGLCSILVGATGKPPADAEEYATHINRITLIVNFGNGNFNNGLRAYYFGVAALSWFLHPVLLIAVTTAVVYVLHQREYHSRTVQAMIDM